MKYRVKFQGTVVLGVLEYKLPVSITDFETKVICNNLEVLNFYSHTHTDILCQFLASFRMDYVNEMCNNIRKAIQVTKRYSDNVYLSYTLQCFFIASCLYWLENVKEDFVL